MWYLKIYFLSLIFNECCVFGNSRKHISKSNSCQWDFDRLLCISTSFWVLHAPKSWSNYFFSYIFNLFCSFQTFFSDFTPEINKKRLKKNKKNPVFVCSSKLVDMQKLVNPLRGYPKLYKLIKKRNRIFLFFSWRFFLF